MQTSVRRLYPIFDPFSYLSPFRCFSLMCFLHGLFTRTSIGCKFFMDGINMFFCYKPGFRALWYLVFGTDGFMFFSLMPCIMAHVIFILAIVALKVRKFWRVILYDSDNWIFCCETGGGPVHFCCGFFYKKSASPFTDLRGGPVHFCCGFFL
jgi:hypothetical protein